MASSVSGALWNNLYYLYFTIAAIVGTLVVAWLFYAMVKYRWRPDRVRPADAPRAGMISVERGHPIWSYVMAGLIALIMFGLAFGTISAIQTMENPPPCDQNQCMYYDVIGYQFGWKYNYTGTGGIPIQILTPGTEQFVVPVDRPVILNITSQDVWHNFAIPEFRIRIDAIPGTVNPLWFQAHETGDYRNVCVVICGVNHAKMHSMMSVVTAEEYDTWLQQRSENEYQRLERNFLRDPARGTIVNATVSDGAVEFSTENVVPNMPVIFNITSTAGSPVTFAVGQNTIEVPAGGTARLYAVAPASGQLEVVAGGQTRALGVSS